MKLRLLKTLTLASALTGALTLSAHAASQGGASVTADLLNLRSEPSTAAAAIATAPHGAGVVIADKSLDGWYKVVYRGRLGYMSADYLSYSETLETNIGRGVIVGSDVRLREGASTDASVLGTYQNGTEMHVLGVYKDWYKVQTGDKIGFVFSDFFGLRPEPAANPAEGDTGQKIVDAAMQYLGVPYVWAGASPTGFDCSGLVYYIYKEFGYTINRTAASNY